MSVTLSGSVSDLVTDDSYSTAFKNLRLRIHRSDGMVPTTSSSVSVAGYYDATTDLLGAFSVAGLVATDADTGIPVYKVEATVLPSFGGPAETHETGWFPLTEDRTLAWVVEHYYPPSGVVWTPGLIQQVLDAVDAAEAAAAAAEAAAEGLGAAIVLLDHGGSVPGGTPTGAIVVEKDA